MARRNRRRKRGGDIAFPAFVTASLLVLCLLALGYVWLDCRCKALGREIKHLEKLGRELTIRCEYQRCRWTEMKSPQSLERALAKYGIFMTLPRPYQVVRFATGQPGPEPWTAAADALAHARIERRRRDE
jgi:hypothetical protein